jgi:phosphohistidine phosphatase
VKNVLICRHAKAEHAANGDSDRDRELTERGEKEARRVATALARLDLVPDLILSSDATRAVQTTRAMLRDFRHEPRTEYLPELYSASASTILDCIATHGPGSGTVMVVGHNPGLEELVANYTGEFVRLKTAHVAVMAVDEDQALPEYPLTGLQFDRVIGPDGA